MFGYVRVNEDALSPEEKKRFSAFYCGLCHALNARYGWTARLTLSYDMTFLAILLNSLYEPDMSEGLSACPRHPGKRHVRYVSAVIDYAADMTMALTHQKALDDWKDERSLKGFTGAKATSGRYARIKALYPEKIAAVEAGLASLSELEKGGCLSIDPPANAFGSILGALFTYKPDDLWAGSLEQVGAGLGRFIYLMDAYDDLEADYRAGRYNPLLPLRGDAAFEEKCRDYLTLLIADATTAFEQLPLVSDLGLLRNILYSGVWAKYQYLQKRREKGRA